jgi:hypothetical protein
MEVEAGKDYKVIIKVTDNDKVDNVTLNRVDTEESFGMQAEADGIYSVTIPGSRVIIPQIVCRITARDRLGNSETTNLINISVVDKEAPKIENTTTVKEIKKDEDLTITVKATDNVAVDKVFFAFGPHGSDPKNWSFVEMVKENDHYKGVIPKASIPKEGIAYKFKASDKSGNSSETADIFKVSLQEDNSWMWLAAIGGGVAAVLAVILAAIFGNKKQ